MFIVARLAIIGMTLKNNQEVKKLLKYVLEKQKIFDCVHCMHIIFSPKQFFQQRIKNCFMLRWNDY